MNPSVNKAREYEKLIDYENMIYEAIKNEEIITINEENNIKKYKDIL